MSEITDYSSLKNEMLSWYKDRTDLAGFADTVVDLTEAYFNLKLRVREMEATTDLTPTDNVCTLPSDYIEYKRVVELASIRRPMEYITEDAADRIYPTRASGLACNFMIVGDDLTALPLSSNDIELTYYQKIPALSDSNTTNWLLTKLPNLYLHTGMMYLAELAEDDAKMTKEIPLVERFVDLLNAADNRGKFGNAGVTLTGAVW
jgi:hypothetical protein